jgi:hypothetical protein
LPQPNKFVADVAQKVGQLVRIVELQFQFNFAFGHKGELNWNCNNVIKHNPQPLPQQQQQP